MGTVYGAPDNYQARVDRLLRRGISVIGAGRSEASAPVKLSERTDRVTRTIPGTPGLPGAPGATGPGSLTRTIKRWARPTINAGTFQTFNMGVTTTGTLLAAPVGVAVNDINGLPRQPRTASGNSVAAFRGLGTSYLLPGDGLGHGGYLAAIQFAFSELAPSRRWWCGVSDGTPLNGDPSSVSNLRGIGVGMDATDTAPFFMHSDSSGLATRVATGFPNVVINKIYEVRVFADPLSTSVLVSFEMFDGGVSTSYQTHEVTSNMPTTELAWRLYARSGSSTVGTMTLQWLGAYEEIQPRL